MSYTSYDEAWKQRVSQERNRASQFRKSFSRGLFRTSSTFYPGFTRGSILDNPPNLFSATERPISRASRQSKPTPSSIKALNVKDYRDAHAELGASLGVTGNFATNLSRKTKHNQKLDDRSSKLYEPMRDRPSTTTSNRKSELIEVEHQQIAQVHNSQSARRLSTSYKPFTSPNINKAFAFRTNSDSSTTEASPKGVELNKLQLASPRSSQSHPKEQMDLTSSTCKSASYKKQLEALHSELQEERKARELLELKVRVLLSLK